MDQQRHSVGAKVFPAKNVTNLRPMHLTFSPFARKPERSGPVPTRDLLSVARLVCALGARATRSGQRQRKVNNSIR